jgi:hypothetical protein
MRRSRDPTPKPSTDAFDAEAAVSGDQQRKPDDDSNH